jgi:hypothetical protein
VIVDVERGIATVQVCNVNTLIKVQRLGDGTDLVIDGGVSEQVEEIDLERIDGVWKVSGARRPPDSEQVASCG